MAVSYTYDTFKSALATATVIPATDSNFLAILPSCIYYAEQRIYRELNLLTAQAVDTSGTLTASNRNFTLPAHFITVDQINVITPVGGTVTNGTRNPLTPVSREFLDMAWPSSTGATLPTFYAMNSDQSIVVGPWPDAAYGVEIVGIQRPTALSASATTTYLTSYLPDLFFAAAMVFMSGYMRNFGSQSDDPKMAQSWEGQYKSLLISAKLEEERKRHKLVPGSTDTPSATGSAA